MKITGNLKKMQTSLEEGLVHYNLPISDTLIPMNRLLGKKIQLHQTGKIHCMHCGNPTIKSFAQGYCYPCFASLPQTAPCILHPERCEAHLGKSRDMEWAEKNCLQPHIVYLARTSGLKVGVTREQQIPVRWMDQGAVEAVYLARTPNRHTAGKIEVSLKKHIADKTNWRKMLQNNEEESLDLLQEKNRVIELLHSDYQEFISESNEVTKIKYPVEYYPKKVQSINLEKTPEFEKELIGIKGQYLIFSDNSVINIRKYGGYEVEFSVENS